VTTFKFKGRRGAVTLKRIADGLIELRIVGSWGIAGEWSGVLLDPEVAESIGRQLEVLVGPEGEEVAE
jgi:hypothetical protein